MSIRHVIYTQEPGIDGTGITTIEKSQIVTGLARIDPAENAAYAGAVVRNSPTGPKWSRDVVYADWYSNINNAITAARAGGNGGVVRVPKNTTIDHSGNDRIPISNGIVLEGEDAESSIIKTSTPGATLLAVETIGADTSRPIIRDLKLHSGFLSAGAPRGAVGLDLRGVRRALIENVEIGQFSDKQIWLGGDYPLYGAGWANIFSKIRCVTTTAAAGVYMSGVVTSGANLGAATADRNTFYDFLLVGMDGFGATGVWIVNGANNMFFGGDIGYGHNGYVFRLDAGATHNKFMFGTSEDVAQFARVAGSENQWIGWGATSTSTSSILAGAFNNAFVEMSTMGTINRADPLNDGTRISTLGGRSEMLHHTPESLLPTPTASHVRQIRYVKATNSNSDDRVVVCIRKGDGTYAWKDL